MCESRGYSSLIEGVLDKNILLVHRIVGLSDVEDWYVITLNRSVYQIEGAW